MIEKEAQNPSKASAPPYKSAKMQIFPQPSGA
jgi:hypothetical protein